MNSLFVGTGDKTEWIRERLSLPFLLIDDGPVIDAIKTKKMVEWDPLKDGLDYFKGMNYRRARDFVALLRAVFPEGESTLARGRADYLIAESLTKHRSVSIEVSKDDLGSQVAQQMIDTLMLSPVIKGVLSKKGTVDGVVLARLDRKKLGDFDCFVLAHLLISKYKGQVVIPDLGFYGRDYLGYLIREERLVCGVNTLSELSPELRKRVLSMSDKTGKSCIAEDAETLASYCGFPRETHEYKGTVLELMR